MKYNALRPGHLQLLTASLTTSTAVFVVVLLSFNNTDGVLGGPINVAALVFMTGFIQANPIRIPLGAIFDRNTTLLHTAFRREMEKHNNSSSIAFQLDLYERVIQKEEDCHLFRVMCSPTFKGIFALFSMTNIGPIRTINSFGRKFHMPYVTTIAPPLTGYSSHTTGRQNNFTIYVRPSVQKAVLDVISHFKWSKVYYLYDSQDGLSRIEFMHSCFNREEINLHIESLRITHTEKCHVALRQLDSIEPVGNKYFILDMSSQEALQSLLRQIQNVGMNRANYHYLLCGLAIDELNVQEFRHGGANITGFRLANAENTRLKQTNQRESAKDLAYWKSVANARKTPLEVALVQDAVLTIVKGLTDLIKNEPEIFRGTFRRGKVYNNNTTVIECKPEAPVWQHGEAIIKSFKRARFIGVSGNMSFDEYGQRNNYTLEVITKQFEDETVKIGTWNPASGLKSVTLEMEENATTAPGVNRTRKVVSILSQPYMMERKLKQQEVEAGLVLTGNDKYEGYCADLARAIADIIGFDYEITIVKDGKYGEKMQDGKWNGMVGELSRREVDIAIAPMTISSMRERVIDFSKPFMNIGISIMIKKPEKQKPGVFSFMDPLSYNIWMCIIFSYLAVSTVLFLVSRFSPNEWQIEDSEHGPAFVNDLTILNSLWFALGAFMRRGCEVCPRSLAGRIVGSAWWFFTLIIISSYTANLAAFLTIERMLTPIKNADDLAKQSEILYGTLDAGSTKDFFKTSKIPTYEKMWSFMLNEPNVFVKTTDVGIQRVRNSKGKYAFLLESAMNDYYNQKKPCDTMKVGENLDSKGYGIATYIESDLREKINVAVLQLLEKEQLQKLHKKWWYDKGECIVESEKKGGGSSQSSLSLSNVAGIFYILISGLGLSMIAASFEFLYKSRLEAKRRSKRYMEKSRSTETASHVIFETTPERENGGYVYSAPCGIATLNTHNETANTQV